MWRKTPAGDEAAIACPTDASGTVSGDMMSVPLGLTMTFHHIIYKYACSLPTGLILRRCSLDAVGLASWENPTHVKCVSKNYENIQMLVSPDVTPSLKRLMPACWMLVGLMKTKRLISESH